MVAGANGAVIPDGSVSGAGKGRSRKRRAIARRVLLAWWK